MSISLDNVTVIIRSIEERTEQLCKKLIFEQGIQEKDLFIVCEVPFSKSMKVSFETGIKQNKKWTFCVDADVLLRPGSIKKAIQFAENQKENVCEVQGFVLDKFFSGPRQAGNHLYRTSLLDKVIARIPDEGVNIRPESYTLVQMKKDGYPWKKIPYVLGIHDSEQYNFDIYRKAFVQAEKHLDHAELFIPHWKKNVDDDPDYRIALHAFSDSIKNTRKLFINSEQDIYKTRFEEAGFKEKKELNLDDYSLDRIEEIIKNWEVDENYYELHPYSQGLDSRLKASNRKLKMSVKKRGIYKSSVLVLSKMFGKISKVLGDQVSHPKFEN